MAGCRRRPPTRASAGRGGIAQNRCRVGIAARTDVLQAQALPANARSDVLSLSRQREALGGWQAHAAP